MHKKRDYNKVVCKLKSLSKRKDYRLNKLGVISYDKKYELFQLVIIKNKKNPNILISAGTHGWEPAGVFALLQFLDKHIDQYLENYNFYIYPCNNPSGFEYDILTNYDGKDLNRQFREKVPPKEIELIKGSVQKGPKDYLIAIDLHEVNPEEDGEGFSKKDNPRSFYLYEDCADMDLRIGHKIIDEIRKQVEVCTWKRIYGDINHKGVVWYPEGNMNPIYQQSITFDQFLFPKYTAQALIFETPFVWNINKRINTHIKALHTALRLKGF